MGQRPGCHVSARAREQPTFDPYFLPKYRWLNEAIERLIADIAAQDPAAFRIRGADIRHAVERYLFFLLFADPRLHERYIAAKRGVALAEVDTLSPSARLLVPYMSCSATDVVAQKLSLKERLLRRLHRLYGRATVDIVNVEDGPPKVLYLVIHRKFVRYLEPIAQRCGVPYAYLVIDDPEMDGFLAEARLPRVHICMTQKSRNRAKSEVMILQHLFHLGVFEWWTIRFNAVRRALVDLRPDCIVVPEGNADVYELVNQCAKTLNVRTLCVQQGWAPMVHPGFRNMTYTAMCVWGEGFADLLKPYNPHQRFVATGNHVILLREQGSLAERRAIVFFLQNAAHWMTAKVWQSTVRLIAWAARSFPESEIRVREHPGLPLTQSERDTLVQAPNIRLMAPDQFRLNDVFDGCRVAVAINSTTILEAAATGIVPLILDVSGWGPYSPDIAASGAAIEVTDFDQARLALLRLIKDDAYCGSFAEPLRQMRQRFFARDREAALDAIVAEIDALQCTTIRRRNNIAAAVKSWVVNG